MTADYYIKAETMITLFEFLDIEPIENVITCMHYKADKVVFFGYSEVIRRRERSTKNFLKKYCGVQAIEFVTFAENDLQSVLYIMRKKISDELKKDHKVFFDLTGGESLLMTAFGILSKEFDTPMHMFDVQEDKLIRLTNDTEATISKDVPVQRVTLNLRRYIELKGGIINTNLQKDFKNTMGADYLEDLRKIWAIASQNWSYWNPFSAFLKEHLVPNDELQVSKSASTIVAALHESKTILDSPDELNHILDALMREGILLNVVHRNGVYRFQYKNSQIRDCLFDGGSILEIRTYLEEEAEADDCLLGVHLDWDGVIHNEWGADVLNEVDVLSLKGNIPTFISCKTGKMNKNTALHALYELETVTRRFGGKYAKKVLISAQPLSDMYLERAREMGIEVR